MKEFKVNPDLYETDKTKKLPVALYLLEADPSHLRVMTWFSL